MGVWLVQEKEAAYREFRLNEVLTSSVGYTPELEHEQTYQFSIFIRPII